MWTLPKSTGSFSPPLQRSAVRTDLQDLIFDRKIKTQIDNRISTLEITGLLIFFAYMHKRVYRKAILLTDISGFLTRLHFICNNIITKYCKILTDCRRLLFQFL